MTLATLVRGFWARRATCTHCGSVRIARAFIDWRMPVVRTAGLRAYCCLTCNREFVLRRGLDAAPVALSEPEQPPVPPQRPDPATLKELDQRLARHVAARRTGQPPTTDPGSGER